MGKPQQLALPARRARVRALARRNPTRAFATRNPRKLAFPNSRFELCSITRDARRLPGLWS